MFAFHFRTRGERQVGTRIGDISRRCNRRNRAM